jgi:hypothetical protein
MERACHAATDAQLGVGGIDDGVEAVLAGDVAHHLLEIDGVLFRSEDGQLAWVRRQPFRPQGSFPWSARIRPP